MATQSSERPKAPGLPDPLDSPRGPCEQRGAGVHGAMSLPVAFALPILAAVSFAAQAVHAEPRLVLQTGHPGGSPGNAIAFSPDGSLAVTAASEIVVWQVVGGRQLRTILPGNGYARSPHFLADGRTLFVDSNAGAELYDVVTGERRARAVLPGSFPRAGRNAHACTTTNVVVNNVAVGSELGCWDLWSGAKLWSAPSGSSWIFSPDEAVLYTATRTELRVIDAATGGLRRAIALPRLAFQLTLRGDKLVASLVREGSGPQGAEWIDPTTGEHRPATADESQSLERLADPDGKRVWELRGKRLALVDAATGATLQVPALEALSKLLLVQGQPAALTEKLEVIALGSGALLGVLRGRALEPESVVLAAGELIVGSWGAHDEYGLRVFDLQQGRQRLALPAQGAVKTGGGRIAGVRGDRLRESTSVAFDAATGRELGTSGPPSSAAPSPAFILPDGRVALGSYTTGLVLWTPGGGTEALLERLPRPEAEKPDLGASSADGRLFAATGVHAAHSVWVGAPRPGAKLVRLPVKKLLDSPPVFSPDGKLVAIPGSTHDHCLYLYDVRGALRWRKLVKEGAINALAFSPRGDRLASAGQDLKLRVWNTADGKSLRTIEVGGVGTRLGGVAWSADERVLFVAARAGVIAFDVGSGRELFRLAVLEGRDWVAFTPDGRFDGSPGGQSLVQLVDGDRVLPLDSFFETHFTPGLVALALGGKPLPEPRADLRRARAPPPRVEIVEPAADLSVTAEELDVSVAAHDQGGGVDELQIFINGKSVAGVERGVRLVGPALSRKLRIALVAGDNEIRAVAFSKERGESAPAIRKVHREGARPRSDLYVVAVGVGHYKNAKYTLQYPRPDAEAFAAALERGGKALYRQVVRIDVMDEEATRAGIEAAVAKVAAGAQPADTFVFYFAGHGVMEEAAGAQGEFYLVPSDVTSLYGESGQLQAKAISGPRLRELSASVKAQRQLLVLDACQSGAATTAFALRGAAEERAILQLARSAGVVLLAATSGDQYAAEMQQLGHGVFTYALLEGLKGRAATDGKITVKHLEAFLNDEVPELTRKYRGSAQYPNSWARGQDFPLVLQ